MNIKPDAPLFRDPIYDGAADPVVVWNGIEQSWWMLYTSRRAYGPDCGITYMHGSEIGIASSSDGGRSWIYRGNVQGLVYEPGRNTYWAPEVIEHEGLYHMYVSYVRGIPKDWDQTRKILHYVSTDLMHWKFVSELGLSSDRVIDACVLELKDGGWKMWYKDEQHNSWTYTAYSRNLYEWEPGGAEITDCAHEGPNVFFWKQKYWMVTDPWEGLGVYKSTDARTWVRCRNILQNPGRRTDDGSIGAHADVLVHKERAYIFYFTHPQVTERERNDPHFIWEYRHRRSSVQAAELFVEDGELVCNRDEVELDLDYI